MKQNFFKPMSSDRYDRLSRAQKGTLILGMTLGVVFEAFACYMLGLIMHNQIPH